jgi:polyhydroxyalkanoate synthesis regulator phasin
MRTPKELIEQLQKLTDSLKETGELILQWVSEPDPVERQPDFVPPIVRKLNDEASHCEEHGNTRLASILRDAGKAIKMQASRIQDLSMQLEDALDEGAENE